MIRVAAVDKNVSGLQCEAHLGSRHTVCAVQSAEGRKTSWVLQGCVLKAQTGLNPFLILMLNEEEVGCAREVILLFCWRCGRPGSIKNFKHPTSRSFFSAQQLARESLSRITEMEGHLRLPSATRTSTTTMPSTISSWAMRHLTILARIAGQLAVELDGATDQKKKKKNEKNQKLIIKDCRIESHFFPRRRRRSE